MTGDELHLRLGITGGAGFMAKDIADAKQFLLSCGLLLRREEPVECQVCEGRGFMIHHDSAAGYGYSTTTIHDYCDGTGSVKRRVIGVRCRDCNGAFEPNEGEGECARCARTPTSGLEPGSETMTSAEQAIMDLVTCEGPKTDRELWIGLGAKSPALVAAKDALLSRDLLLGYEGMVECSTCGGSGGVYYHVGLGGIDVCPTCDGFGSVKVIGRPCNKCRGAATLPGCPSPRWAGPYKFRCSRGDQDTLCSIHGRFQREPCPKCSPTLTPGLEPGKLPNQVVTDLGGVDDSPH